MMKDFKKKLAYHFDNYISKGLIAQCIILFVSIFILVLVFGLLVRFTVGDFTVRQGLWQSLMHMIDPGTICGDDTANLIFISIMLAVTFLGMAFTGTIVGIINNAMSEKLDDLKKGRSQIIEEGHILIIGFDDSIHTILNEIITSNENWEENRTIVVIDEMETEEMTHIVKEKRRLQNDHERKKNAKKSPIIFRSGSIISENTYLIASAEKARSIIINKEDDFEVIRVTLALSAYLKKQGAYLNDKMPTIVSMMHEQENMDAAYIAAGVYHEDSNEALLKSEDKVRIMYFEDILAHIFAQVCRQPGLSFVISEIFNYDDTEIYIEKKLVDGRSLKEAGFVGRSFQEICELASNFTPIGIKRDQKIILNPDLETTILQENDELIHISEDDNELMPLLDEKREAIGVEIEEYSLARVEPYHFLFFGYNEPSEIIVNNISQYCPVGSSITILHIDREQEAFVCPYHGNCQDDGKFVEEKENVVITHIKMDPYDWKSVKNYLDYEVDWSQDNPNRITNIIILCSDDMEKVEADEKSSVLLLKIREYLKKRNLHDEINLTAEMNLAEDQYLLQHMTSNDFIVGSEMANMMMVQVAENPYMLTVFEELLNKYGSEIYLRRFSEYVDLSQPYNFEKICEIGRNRSLRKKETREIVIGWINLGTDDTDPLVSLNPIGEERTRIMNQQINENESQYRLVVIAME